MGDQATGFPPPNFNLCAFHFNKMNNTASRTKWRSERFKPLQPTEISWITRRLTRPLIENNRKFGRSLLLICLCVGLVRIWLAMNTPLAIFGFAGHDDGLFMRQGLSLISGDWLGPYDQRTLAKGPGYGLFLAFSHLTGLPISIMHALFHTLCVAGAAWAIWIVTRSRWIVFTVFAMLCLYPIALHPLVMRIIRDQIYWGQTLLVFASFAVAFLGRGRPAFSWATAAAGGLIFGWAWLTREEGLWLLPAVVILALGGIFIRWRERSALRVIMVSILIASAGFGAVQMVFRTANYHAYGTFAGLDMKAHNFQRVVKVLQSIDSDDHIPYVPVSQAALRKAMAASEVFQDIGNALLKPQPLFNGWNAHGCAIYPHTCDEIAGGWFVWALRDSVANAGYYENPVRTEAFYEKIADQLEAACQSAVLQCGSGGMAFIPPMKKSQFFQMPQAAWQLIGQFSYMINSDVPRHSSSNFGKERHRSDLLDLLHNPLLSENNTTELFAQGWYFDMETPDFPKFRVSNGKSVKALDVQRLASPDLVTYFSNEAASNNRFLFSFSCPPGCQLEIVSNRGEKRFQAHDRLGTFQEHISGATLYFDQFEGPQVSSSSAAGIASRLYRNLNRIYTIVVPAIVAVGLLAMGTLLFFACYLRTLSVLFVFCLALWSAIAARLLILTLIHVGSFPAAALLYTLPANYLLLWVSLLSIHAAWSQWVSGHQRGDAGRRHRADCSQTAS